MAERPNGGFEALTVVSSTRGVASAESYRFASQSDLSEYRLGDSGRLAQRQSK